MSLSATTSQAPRDVDVSALATGRAEALIYFGLLAVMTIPVMVWPIPHSFDLVNHWARLTLLGMSANDPLRAHYAVHFGMIPNLAIDLLYLALSPIASAQTVARLAFALSFWLPSWGAWRLHRALFDKVSPTIYLAPVLSYNLISTGGLVNYGMGLGIGLLTLAWAAGQVERKPRDWLVLNLAAAAIFFCHLIALAAYLVMFVAMEIMPRAGETWRAGLRRALMAPLAFLVAPVLIAMAPLTPSGYQFGSDKSQMLVAPFTGMDHSDAIFRLLVLAIVAVGALRGLKVARPAWFAMIAFGGFALAAPSAHGAASMIDARLAVGWVYFALAVVSLKAPPRLASAFGFAIVLLAAFRLTAITPTWREFDTQVSILRDALRALPANARAIVVTPSACSAPGIGMLAEHTVLAAIDERAMVSTLYAGSGMQPLRRIDATLDQAPALPLDARWLTQAGRRELGDVTTRPWAAAYVNWRDHFNAVIYVHAGCEAKPPAPDLTRIASSSVADVYLTKAAP